MRSLVLVVVSDNWRSSVTWVSDKGGRVRGVAIVPFRKDGHHHTPLDYTANIFWKHLGQKPRRLIACRLDDPTVKTRQGVFHEGIPGVVIACESRLLQNNGVAHGVHPHQRQTACKRFILC